MSLPKPPVTTALKQALKDLNIDTSKVIATFSDPAKHGVSVKFSQLFITDEQKKQVKELMEEWGYKYINISIPDRGGWRVWKGTRFYFGK